MSISKAFLGRGLKYPLSVGKDGDFSKNRDNTDQVRDSIIFLLHTRIGERVHSPLIGSRLMDFKHESNSPQLRSLLAQEILRTVETGEPRISDLQVNVESSPNNERVVFIKISFTVIPENVEQNLVFPFYLD